MKTVFRPSLQSTVLEPTSGPILKSRGRAAQMDTSGEVTERLVFTTITATGLFTVFVADWFLPGKPAALTLVAGTQEESVVRSKNREQSQGGTKCIAS